MSFINRLISQAKKEKLKELLVPSSRVGTMVEYLIGTGLRMGNTDDTFTHAHLKSNEVTRTFLRNELHRGVHSVVIVVNH